MIENALEISALRKTYRKSGKSPEKTALHSIDLAIPRGSIFGLLGPNGAGKSTLINIMAGLVVKTSGTVKIWDIDVDQDARRARAAIGVVPQEINFDPFFSPLRMLDIQAGLYGVPKAERRSLELLDLVGLKDKANAYTQEGGLAVLRGNLAPDGAVIKSTAIDPRVVDEDGVYRKRGRARVFTRERAAIQALWAFTFETHC